MKVVLVILVFSIVAITSYSLEIEEDFLFDVDWVRVEVWVSNLKTPWSLVFLPDGRALVTERIGRISLIKDNKVEEKPYFVVKDVYSIQEAGLLGIAIHPNFYNQPYVYVYYTYRHGGVIYNKVIRLRDKGSYGVFDGVIIDKIPGSAYHNGGRIGFGPDGMLYITTGEIFKRQLAQDLSSLGGKILRISPDGSIPNDNPFKGSPVYSYGHRNPQGLAWHPNTGVLFSSEHGPSGEMGLFGHDEINIIFKGSNYGWPLVVGNSKDKKYVNPLVFWKDTVPPSGMCFWNGDIYVATLRSRSLVRIILEKYGNEFKVKKIERWFASKDGQSKYGRLRDVVVGPDGNMYLLSNNTDGRGTPMPGDDKIYVLKKISD